MASTFRRCKSTGPEWLKSVSLEEIPKPFYKITIKTADVSHDGYCSGAEDYDYNTYNETIICYSKNKPEINEGFEWEFPLVCQFKWGDILYTDFDSLQSGYCNLGSKAEIENITFYP